MCIEAQFVPNDPHSNAKTQITKWCNAIVELENPNSWKSKRFTLFLMQTLYISTLLALFLCTKTKVFGMFSAKFQTFRWISFRWFERARNVRSYVVDKVLGTKPKNFMKALKCMRIEQNIMRWRVTKPTKLFLSLRCCNCLF